MLAVGLSHILLLLCSGKYLLFFTSAKLLSWKDGIIFSKAFITARGNGHMISVLKPIYVMYQTHWYIYAEPIPATQGLWPLQPWVNGFVHDIRCVYFSWNLLPAESETLEAWTLLCCNPSLLSDLELIFLFRYTDVGYRCICNVITCFSLGIFFSKVIFVSSLFKLC